jgi:hypothetical protein
MSRRPELPVIELVEITERVTQLVCCRRFRLALACLRVAERPVGYHLPERSSQGGYFTSGRPLTMRKAQPEVSRVRWWNQHNTIRNLPERPSPLPGPANRCPGLRPLRGLPPGVPSSAAPHSNPGELTTGQPSERATIARQKRPCTALLIGWMTSEWSPTGLKSPRVMLLIQVKDAATRRLPTASLS